ncbi:hypothetical protein KDI99_gp44 [Arthrobacter phage Greenhouse]|uniref:Uncharacterized protein n=2 Tax=Korravirus TaxID=1982076 RepID=A0A1I9SE66_9CAUD|nr:hypothetical protein KDI99_gp44 [Arthrobacter phage Greenhouse]YP_010050395.1 hypothetical protein KDJ05_gp43 [Arthrobacter phage Oxynfrius]AOZ65080.1 hypothetical protein SEA_OXYNFRIUS_43 [Arthrobacter phage Oxynfrius]AOZ65143.1 hypothetical protein SEA_GREENHOUSE_44 [Arthrobacter phage Greenhouse]
MTSIPEPEHGDQYQRFLSDLTGGSKPEAEQVVPSEPSADIKAQTKHTGDVMKELMRNGLTREEAFYIVARMWPHHCG